MEMEMSLIYCPEPEPVETFNWPDYFDRYPILVDRQKRTIQTNDVYLDTASRVISLVEDSINILKLRGSDPKMFDNEQYTNFALSK